ncbi:hypothetical protein JOF39_000487 [Glutamicibacter protophormiae]|uniref:Uncharacterized protein n=1 Tax=Glutamicibacter protophormiae TaxID=37930 RepID=A0ABS4XLM1_GLUPR|nr:hypothetical protein [Glutamicibacter protophormiae]
MSQHHPHSLAAVLGTVCLHGEGRNALLARESEK